MSNITIQCVDCISTVTIDNPPENYLSREVLSKLNKAVSEMLLPEADLRVVLLTARGKNFSSGIDYASFVNMTKAEAAHFAEALSTSCSWAGSGPSPSPWSSWRRSRSR